MKKRFDSSVIFSPITFPYYSIGESKKNCFMGWCRFKSLQNNIARYLRRRVARWPRNSWSRISYCRLPFPIHPKFQRRTTLLWQRVFQKLSWRWSPYRFFIIPSIAHKYDGLMTVGGLMLFFAKWSFRVFKDFPCDPKTTVAAASGDNLWITLEKFSK